MTKLKGSEKQVSWAESLRKEWIDRFGRRLQRMTDWIDQNKDTLSEDDLNKNREDVKKFALVFEYIKNQDEAVWFINRRSKLIPMIIKNVMKQIGNGLSVDEITQSL